MAVCLLARIDGHVTAEAVERLLDDAEGAPVARGAHYAGAGELRHGARDGAVHLARGHDLVADQAPFRARAVDPQLGQHRLARDARADVALEAQVGGPRDDAFLARRQRHVGIFGGEHVVERKHGLAMTTDGEALDRADPQLFDPIHLWRYIRAREAAVELVHEPQVANDVPEVADLPLVEVREVDAGAEQTLAGVPRVRHFAAAQHADFALLVQRGN